ncbi:MAG: gliding motility-associated C-terminal domain-containing protein, partial [Bacteroidia bacterium]
SLISWLWNIDNHSISDLQHPRYVFTDAGSYQTSLYVTTDKGCTDAASKIIFIKEKEACDTDTDFSLFILSAFTPNNDGINDFFVPSGKNSGELQMKIFDRWGETVFENSGSNTSWNGRGTKEIPLNEGAYAYEIAAKDLSGIVHYFTGHLLLLR